MKNSEKLIEEEIQKLEQEIVNISKEYKLTIDPLKKKLTYLRRKRALYKWRAKKRADKKALENEHKLKNNT